MMEVCWDFWLRCRPRLWFPVCRQSSIVSAPHGGTATVKSRSRFEEMNLQLERWRDVCVRWPSLAIEDMEFLLIGYVGARQMLAHPLLWRDWCALPLMLSEAFSKPSMLLPQTRLSPVCKGSKTMLQIRQGPNSSRACWEIHMRLLSNSSNQPAANVRANNSQTPILRQCETNLGSRKSLNAHAIVLNVLSARMQTTVDTTASQDHGPPNQRLGAAQSFDVHSLALQASPSVACKRSVGASHATRSLRSTAGCKRCAT